MGDAFKGLTIRLGADARPLQSALSSISKSANQTQQQMKKLSTALKFDPTNVKLMADRITVAGDKMTLTARSARTLRSALDQASKDTVSIRNGATAMRTSIKEAANAMRNVNASAERANGEFTRLNAELQQVYDAMAMVLVKSDGMRFDKAVSQVKKMADEFKASGAHAKEIYALMRSAVMSRDIRSPLGAGNTVADANRLYSVYKNLVHMQKEAQANLEDINKVKTFRNHEIQLQSYRAELKKAAAEMADYKAEMYSLRSAPGLEDAVAKSKRLDSALEASISSLREMREVYASMPNSVDALRQKNIAVKNAQDAMLDKARALKEVMNAAANSKMFNKTAASLGNVRTAMEKAKADASEYAAALTKAQEKVRVLRQELADAENRNFFGTRRMDIIRLTNELNKANAELREMETRSRAADEALEAAAVNARWREASDQLARVNSQLARLKEASSVARSVFNIGAGMREFGYGLYSTVTPALMIAGRYAIQAANDIDAAYRDMRKTVNGSEEDFEHLRDAALEFSSTHFTSADTILEIEAMGGQLGIAVGNLEAFSEVISNLEIATDISAEDMAKYVGQLSNIMRDIDQTNPDQYQKDITAFSDALVRLGNNSAAQESSIMKVMMRIASMGTICEFTTPQLLAVSTAVAATGQGAEAAGTAISRTFSNIEQAVGAGGEKLEAFAEVAGMTAEEFAELWNTAPMEAFNAFIGGLKKIDEAGGSVDATLASLKINAVRQKQAIMGLVTTYDVLQNSLKMANTAWNGQDWVAMDGNIEHAGDAAREAQRKSEGFSGELQIMKNNAQMLAQELSQGALPIISTLGDAFREFTSIVKRAPGPLKTTVVAILAMVAALGPLNVWLGTSIRVMSRIPAVASAFGVTMTRLSEAIFYAGVKIEGTHKTMSKAMTGIGNALSKMSTWGVIAGIAATVAVIKTLADAFDAARKKTENYNKAIGGLKDAAHVSPNLADVEQSIDGIGRAAEAAKPDVDALVESQAKLSDSINERNASAKQEIADLEAARRIVKEYANQSGLTALEQYKLSSAIDLINEKCGTQYKIVDAMNGKIQDEKGVLLDAKGATDDYVSSLDNYIDAKKKAIQLDALAADMAELQQQQADNTVELTKAYQSLAEAEAARDEAYDNSKDRTQQELDDADARVQAAQAEIDSIKEVMAANQEGQQMIELAMGSVADASNNAAKSMSELAAGNQDIYKSFEGDNKMFELFRNELNECGLSVDQFNSITSEQWAEIIGKYKAGAGSLYDIMSEMGVEMPLRGTEAARQWVDGLDSEMQKAVYAASAATGLTLDEIKRFGGELAEEGKFNADKFANAFNEGIENNLSPGQAAQAAVNEMIEAIGESASEAETAAESVAEAAVANVEEYEDDWGEAGEDSGSAYVDGLEEYEDYVSDEADSYADAMRNADISDEGYDWGYDLGENIASGLKNSISDIESAANAAANAQRGANASGGVVPTNANGGVSWDLIRAIPMHANGGINGIVARPTLTNVGWAGENGAEAILHMRHAGGAIIPLTNRRYVRPFARAVAMEINPYGGTNSSNTYNITVNASGDGDDIARAVTKAIRSQELMMGRR